MFKRAATVAGLVVAGALVPLATAAPASASQGQCTGVVSTYGYIVGPKVLAACSWPALPGNAPHFNCWNGLAAAGVKVNHALTACSWA